MRLFERLFIITRKPWFIAIFALLLFFMYQYIDRPIAVYVHQQNFMKLHTLFAGISLLGKWSISLVALLFLALFFRYAKKNAKLEANVWYLFSCVFITNMIASIIKVVFGRARPYMLFDASDYGFYWFSSNDAFWSLPSGHSVTAFALASALSVLNPRYSSCYLLGAVIIALTRIPLYAHYASDIMAGAFLGVLIVGVWTHLLSEYGGFYGIGKRASTIGGKV